MRALPVGAALVALLCAPLVAIADGLHAGNFADAPAYARGMRGALAPLLDFAAPHDVMRLWQGVLASATLVVLALARPPRDARPAWAAWAAAALATTGALLEALAGETPVGTLGVAAYFVGLPLLLLTSPLAGALRLRRTRDRLAASLLALTPLALLLTLALPHLPAPQIAAASLAWAATERA